MSGSGVPVTLAAGRRLPRRAESPIMQTTSPPTSPAPATGVGGDHPLPEHRHMPALDGLRALAVAGVVAYHLGLPGASGGYLGVDLFFVLSGFLITGLLVAERSDTGRIRLGGFWGRRARRLLPALLVVLAAVTVWAALGGPGVNRGVLRGDALAALFYVANWHFVAAHTSYFAQFQAPSPLEHTWSLAIEEQFYLVWPFVVLAVGRWGGRRWRRTGLVVAVVAGVASVAAMALLTPAGSGDPSRAYFGTDARAFELLAGAALGFITAGRPRPSKSEGVALHWVGPVALAALLAGWCTLGGPPRWMFTGGFAVAAGLAAVVIASVSRPDPGPLGRVLSLRPLRWVGRISYGLYLWHWPAIVLLTTKSTGLSGASLDLLRVAVTVAASTASFYLVEQPIRRGRPARWRLVAAPTAVAAMAGVVVAATIPGATAVAALSATAGLPAGASAKPAVFPLGFTPTPARPLRIMSIGDSVMHEANPGVGAALQATGVITFSDNAFPGWGLTIDHDFAQHLAAVIASVHPDVVIGTWSWDDDYARAHPEAYSRLLDQAVSAILTPGDGVRGVVLLQFPKVGRRLFEKQESMAEDEAAREAWNRIAAAEAARRPAQVSYLPVASALEIDGQFATWLPGPGGTWSRARQIDNTHPCPTGAARYGAAITSDLARAWNLPEPKGTWWQGSWVNSPVYNDPPGSCPADQPPASLVRAYDAAHR
ncbi:MAG TPA: acyltransferase family protein [Acidimicrobiales bacterium]|nr:acyltransferase family protein [Acidimicrobiales bacterium]